MIHAIAALSTCLFFARWALIIAFCFFLYRRLSLPSLPWLAAHYAIGTSVAPTASYLLKHSMPAAHSRASYMDHPSIGTAMGYLVVGAELVSALVAILIVVLVTSEIAFLISAHDPKIESGLISRLLKVRRHVPAIGVSLVLLSILPAISSLAFWLCYHAKTGA